MSAPRPPSDLNRRTPDIVAIETGAVLHRFYPAALEPIYFDRSLDGRLNAPDGGFGVLYAAVTINGAFAETFLRQPGRRIIPDDLIQAKSLVRLQVLRPLRLIKLAGPGLAKLGATAEVTHGGLPYEIPQAWSAALHAASIRPPGPISTLPRGPRRESTKRRAPPSSGANDLRLVRTYCCLGPRDKAQIRAALFHTLV